MEYPLFVAGQTGRSAIHVTDLSDFSPLTAGEVVVALSPGDGPALEFRGGPSRPGIFGVDLQVDRPGDYTMTLRIDAPGVQDLHELGSVTVHPAGGALDGGDEAEAEGEPISFLKEQQWKLEFGTEPVQVRSLQSSLAVPAAVRPRSGSEVVLAAPVPGQIDPASSAPALGSRVRAGALVTRIVPRSDDARDPAGLRAALVEAEQRQQLATQERERAERLVESRALPARRLSEAEAELAASNARLEAARQRWSRFGSSGRPHGAREMDYLGIHAPFAGVVIEVGVVPGASVEADQFLARIVDTERVEIVGAIPEAWAAKVASIEAGELLRDGMPPLSLGRPVSRGAVVDTATRTIDVRFAFDNRAMQLQVGHSVGLRLLVGPDESQPAVPESAIVDDGGRPVVFVQVGGESFERRFVTLGNRAAGHVHVLQGVAPGERVVSRGAYLVRLAAMSTQIPAHGHMH